MPAPTLTPAQRIEIRKMKKAGMTPQQIVAETGFGHDVVCYNTRDIHLPKPVPEEVVAEMRRLKQEGGSVKEIAQKFGLKPERAKWYMRDIKSKVVGHRKPSWDVEQILYDHYTGMSKPDLRAEYGMTRSSLDRYLKRWPEFKDKIVARLKAEVIEAYEDGDDIANIMAWSGRGRTTIKDWVGYTGATRNYRSTSVKGLDRDRIVWLYTQTDEISTGDLAHHFGVSTPAIIYQLKRAGIEINRRLPKTYGGRDHKIELIKKLESQYDNAHRHPSLSDETAPELYRSAA